MGDKGACWALGLNRDMWCFQWLVGECVVRLAGMLVSSQEQLDCQARCPGNVHVLAVHVFHRLRSVVSDLRVCHAAVPCCAVCFLAGTSPSTACSTT